jgi:hypothetical protein
MMLLSSSIQHPASGIQPNRAIDIHVKRHAWEIAAMGVRRNARLGRSQAEKSAQALRAFGCQ